MFKEFSTAALAFAAMSGAALAQSPSTPIVYQGELVVTAANASCPADRGVSVGDFAKIIYRPIIAAGDPPEGLVLYYAQASLLIISTAGNGSLNGSVPYSAGVHSARATGFNYTATSKLKVKPYPVTAATLNITMDGTINNPFNFNGCVITIRAALTQRL